MVKTSITLRDMGYRTAGTAGSVSVRAVGDNDNAGSALTLEAVDVRYTITEVLNDKNVPNRFENNDQNEIFGLSEVDAVGVGVPTWNVEGVFDMESTDGRKMFAKLVMFTKTQGVKELSGVNTANCWVNYLNYYDDYYAGQAKATGTTIDHVHVRVKNFNVRGNAGRKYAKWTMELRETK